MPDEHERESNIPAESQAGAALGGTEPSQVVIRGPVDAIALVAYMVGYHPSRSLVVVGISEQGRVVGVRQNLPLPGRAASAGKEAEAIGENLVAVLNRNGSSSALLLGYGPDEQVTPVMEGVLPTFNQAGVQVLEALRVDQGRWWSYTCQNPSCCPPEGTAYDVSTSVIAAQATLAGQVVLDDRDQLVESVAPVQGKERTAMEEATKRAEQRMRERIAASGSRADKAAHLIDEGRTFIAELADQLRTGEIRLDDDEVAWLGLLLSSVRLRDEAWVRIDVDHLRQHVEFWRDVVRRVGERYVAAPASLLAYAAFEMGDGALANVALDRACAADPLYSMAHLIREIVTAGIPPEKARLDITPEELAAAYAEREYSQNQQSPSTAPGSEQPFSLRRTRPEGKAEPS